MTAHLRLTPFRGDEDDDQFASILASAHPDQEDVPRQMLEQTRSFLAANPRPDPWGSYLAWDGDMVVGACSFKTPPDSSGSVEIAYVTFPAHEGRGFAKRMIAALFAIAARSGASMVVAHTLPADNPSNGALRREGFGFAGEVNDPEDGPVWRWARQV